MSGRTRVVRITVDLAPDDYMLLRSYAFNRGMSHAAVMRAALHLLLSAEPQAGEP